MTYLQASKSTLEILQVISAGASISIDGSTRPILDLMQMAAAAATRGVRLNVRGASSMEMLTLLRIAAAARGSVTFEF
jgi:hypothetical protein